jgi:hypothetical protein
MKIESPSDGGVVLEIEVPNPYPSVQGIAENRRKLHYS